MVFCLLVFSVSEGFSIEKKIEMLKTHLDGEIELRGEKVGIKFFRKFYPYYIAGIKNAAKIRSVLVTEEDYGKIISTLTALLQVC